MRARVTLMTFVLGLTVLATASAQWRENQPSVITPQPQQSTPTPDDIGPFRKKYESAGSPRIVLFWNVSFDDQIESTKELVDTTANNSAKKNSSSEESTAGEAGDAAIRDGDETSSESSTRRQTNRLVDAAKRSDSLNEKTRLQLQAVFGSALRDAKVTLLDRALLMRSAIITNQNATLDAKQIEARVITEKADLLLEVLLVADKTSPLGYGFKVSVKHIKRGEELVSLYTLAMPEVAAVREHYVATDQGFERKQGVAPELTTIEVGTQLAIDVMKSLGSVL